MNLTSAYVLNPSHAELLNLAQKFEKERVDLKYFASLFYGYDSYVGRLLQKKFVPHLVRSILVKRVVSLKDENIIRSGIYADVLFIILKRFSTDLNQVVIYWRNRRIERRAIEHMRFSPPSIVISQQTLGYRILEEANRLGIPAILNYPIAHHSWASKILSEEKRINPQWSTNLGRSFFVKKIEEVYLREIYYASKILVGSNFVARTFIESGIEPSRILVSNYGSDFFAHSGKENFDLARRSPRKSDHPLNVAFLGQVVQRKGIGYLAEAFDMATLPENSKLWIMGPVASRKLKRKLSKFKNIVLTGKISKKEVRERLEECDLYILPSLVEGFALSAIEAMSLGVPVVVSQNTGVADIVENYVDGFVVEARSLSDLVQILEYSAQHPEILRQIGISGYEKSLRYDWESYKNRTLNIIIDWMDDLN